MRKLPKQLRLKNSGRLLLVWLYRLFPSTLSAIRIVLVWFRRLRDRSTLSSRRSRDSKRAEIGGDIFAGRQKGGKKAAHDSDRDGGQDAAYDVARGHHDRVGQHAQRARRIGQELQPRISAGA
jgi:hypothetical protein